MPYGTKKSGKKTQVVNKETGHVYGTHSSKAKANKQLAALHIHTDEGFAPSMTEVFAIDEGRMSVSDVPDEAREDFAKVTHISPWDDFVKFFKNGNQVVAKIGNDEGFWVYQPATWPDKSWKYRQMSVVPPASDEPPKMESVFHVNEAPIQNRPPPGSKPVKPTDWNALGRMGQSLQKGLDAMKSAGQEMNVYSTPDGQRLAYPKDAAPGRPPMRADDTKGVWTPQTGSAAGTPAPPMSPTTTMK